MDLNTRDMVMKKLLDAQENVRDYESFSKKIDDSEAESIFKQLAEESGQQAQQLQELFKRLDN